MHQVDDAGAVATEMVVRRPGFRRDKEPVLPVDIAYIDRVIPLARQRSTPPFIEDVQRDCLDRLDATRSPDAVLGRLERAVNELQAGNVAVSGSSNGIVSPSR